MAEEQRAPTREEKLAAKLRENLRRRKAQMRAMEARPDSIEEGEALSKEEPSR